MSIPHHATSAVVLLTIFAACAAVGDEPDLGPLVELLTEVDDAELQLDLLRGMRDGLRGRKKLPMPAGWQPLSTKLSRSDNAEIREIGTVLSLLFGDTQALARLRRTLLDKAAPVANRQAALLSLVGHGTSDLAPTLLELLSERAIRRHALRGLARYDDESTAATILELYPELDQDEREDAIQTLASRPSYAVVLLDAVAEKRVARREISAVTARQLEALNDERLTKRLREVWGSLRRSSTKKQRLIAKYKELLSAEYLQAADLGQGRALYDRTCGKCHVLYGVGAKIGPDLTGSNRADLGYLLENILDPSAAVGNDYELQLLVTTDGRLLTGLIVETTDHSLTVQTVTERVIVAKEDILAHDSADLSMMPEGQIEAMSKDECRDLVAYLMSTSQAPLPLNGE